MEPDHRTTAVFHVISKPPPHPHRYASYHYSVETLAAPTSLGPEGGPPCSQTHHRQAAACIDPWTWRCGPHTNTDS
jgi:hypothetical protein